MFRFLFVVAKWLLIVEINVSEKFEKICYWTQSTLFLSLFIENVLRNNFVRSQTGDHSIADIISKLSVNEGLPGDSRSPPLMNAPEQAFFPEEHQPTWINSGTFKLYFI